MSKGIGINLHLSVWNIADYCALYIVIWSVTPILVRGDIYRYLAGIASVIFLLKTLKNRTPKIMNYVLASGLLIALHMLNVGFFGGNISKAIAWSINLFVFCMLGLISLYYQEIKKHIFYQIAKIIMVIYFFTTIPSIIALQSNIWILRNASGKTERVGIEKFAGSYGYAFGCLFLVILLIYDLRVNHKEKQIKYIEAALVILFGYIVSQAGYTTALVLMVIGVFMALFFPKKNKMVGFFIFLFLTLLLLLIIPIALDWVVNNLQLSAVYRAKFNYLAQLTNSSSDITYADSTRGEMFFESLEALIQNPVLGSLLLKGREASSGHAVLLDTLVNHGIFYFVIYLYVIILTPWRMVYKDRTLQLIYLTMIIFLGLTDTIDYATMAIPIFIAPMIVDNALVLRKEDS